MTVGENAEELRLIANGVPALLSYIGADGRYVWCNEGYNREFGLTSEQIRGKHIRDVLGIAGWESVRPHFTRALAGEPVTYENQVRVKDGSLYYANVSFVPHRDGNGCVRGIITLVRDVSEQKAAEGALRKSERMLERSQSTAHVGSWELELDEAGRPLPGTTKWSA